MRLDRFITLNLIHLLRTGRESRRSMLDRFFPVLMYHSISGDSESDVRTYYRVCTDSERFREQMQWLKDNGYHGVTLSAGLAWPNSVNGKQCKTHCLRPPTSDLRPVAITFDDGYHDFYTTALPILRRHNFSATVFLPTAFIGQEPQNFKGRACMTWDEVRESAKAGIEFGSHTVNHPKLYELGLPQIRAELKESKTAIENELGQPVRSFAYPYAFPSADRAFVKSFVELLKETGYDCNVTTKIGLAGKNDDPFTLKRLPVNSADDEALFLAKLAGAYDWLAWPQETFKTMKSFISHRHSRPVTNSVFAKNI